VKVGDSILCEGPVGLIKYHGYGDFVWKKDALMKKKRVGLVAGGSGITPLLSLALASSFAKDGLEITMIYSNKTKDDIMC
jgi:ferredoxin-NADP reductase